MTPDRNLMLEDIEHCLWHPERHAVGWTDLRNPETGAVQAVGACEECLPPPETRRIDE